MVVFTKIVSIVNLKALSMLPKRLILIAWLGPRCVSADGYITVIKIHMEICKDGGRVKIGSF